MTRSRTRPETQAASLGDDLLQTCEGAVNRVLAELPARERQVLEVRRAEVVAATHRETLAALTEIQGALEPVA